MIVAYRLSSSRYPAHSGKGAALHGGRWNLTGTEVIYISESRSLAALEILVQFAVLPRDFVISEIRIPDRVKIVEAEELYNRQRDVFETITGESPAVVDFSSLVRGSVASTRSIGASWIDDRTYAVLSVPSSIIPEERNYVLNVAHPDFRHIEFLQSKPFQFDRRLKPTAK